MDSYTLKEEYILKGWLIKRDVILLFICISKLQKLKDNAVIQNDLGKNSGSIGVFITDGLPPSPV
ncbi:MAG: hypothetical protein IPL25_13015 [Saprospiraceae bacterium]|nr:hypothetical protein [Candidatus Vicinibacter affinis]